MSLSLLSPPAGPRRPPILGHLPDLLLRPLPFFQNLRDLGEVVEIRLGPESAYVVNNPELIRQMLVADVSQFDKGVQYDKLRALIGEGLSTAHGVAHRDRRRLIQPAFHARKMAGYLELANECAQSLVDSWHNGEIIPIPQAMLRLSLRMVTKALCSAEINAGDMATIARDLPVVLKGVPWRALMPTDKIERLPLPFNRRFAEANLRLRDSVVRIIESYQASEEQHDDLLGLLLSGHDHSTGQPLSMNAIRDEVVNLLFAGTETTARALAWLWHAIGSAPDVERRVHVAADNGDSAYLGRVVRETLRLYPPPWLLTRRARQDVELGGYRIPAGGSIFFSPYAIHHDSTIYPHADVFDPDRWLPERPQPPRHAYLPFSTGPHNCIGERFALTEMTAVLDTIAKQVRLVPVSNVIMRPSATLMPRGLRMRVIAR